MSMRRLLTAAALLPALLAPAVASADQLTVRGTQVFRSVAPPSVATAGDELTVFNGFAYFVANDDVNGNELWRTDGTNEGTRLVQDLRPGPASSAASNSNPHRLTVVGDRLFFNAYSNATESNETVFYIDAADPNTVKQPLATRVTGGQVPAVGTIFGAPNGRLVISRLLGEQGNCCYAAYALPPGGTVMTKISVGAEDVGTNQSFSPSATAGGWTYYSRSNTNVSPGEPAELWRTNGSTTEEVKNIYPDAGNVRGGSAPSGFVATSDRVYFTADDGTHGRELWVTNPADKSDTHLVYEHVPGTGGTSIDDPGAIANGNILYYVPANDPVTGSEVWRTDGTLAGTRVVKDITPGPGGQSLPALFALGGGLGILRGSSVFGSDGTDAGTSLLANVDGDGYGPNSPVVLGGRGYFVGGATPFGQALWRTDGTAAGTRPISAAGFDGTAAKSGSPSVQSLIPLGSKLIFFGRDPETNDTGRVKLFVLDTTLPDEPRVATPAPAPATPAPNPPGPTPRPVVTTPKPVPSWVTLGKVPTTLKAGALIVSVKCPSTETAGCAGKLALTIQAKKGKTTTTKTIATASFKTIKAGRSKSVSIKVPATYRSRLRSGSLKVTVTAKPKTKSDTRVTTATATLKKTK
ncbi:MAG: hypothetical protein Q7T55_26790 [Solirubrobacteraceae bacterium]|nr:hypothetical protein [Solirubrobacteraceae bacterium]